MPRLRLLIPAVLALAVMGIVATNVVAARVRARQHADWFEGKNLTLAPVVKGLKEPTLVVGAPDAKRYFVLERAGRIKVADLDGNLQPTPFLDLSATTSTSTEQGMLGLAFHPRYAENGYVYVDYTDNDSTVQIIRYTVSPPTANTVDPATAQTVMAIKKGSKYHNGGTLEFGRDGYLYISIGDDEGSEKAQDLSNIYGKILRVDVDSASPYAIPPDNPFVNRADAKGEIWVYGLRNPWRFSFDRANGDMWIGDVGDAREEEVDLVPSGTSGQNFGFPYLEGDLCMDETHCHDPGLVPPLATYGHDMNCAVMGGYVYRGPTAARLVGTYLFGDLCTGGVFALADPSSPRVELGFQPIKISSFGQDSAGDVYVVDMQGGVIYRVMDGSLP
jgi:glucose/arabinose dehydrogenase